MVAQIRREFHNDSTVNDYVQNFSESYIYALQTTNYKSTPADIIPVAIGKKILSRLGMEV